jgi:hypothetical protein
MFIVLFDSELDGSTALSNINPAAFTWDVVYTRLFLSDFMKLQSSQQIFEKCSNIKFHEIRPVGAELFHGNDEAESRFKPLCESDKHHFEDFGVAGRIILKGILK